MTKKEVIDQVYGLSVGGYFNHEKFTKKRFTDYVNAMLKTGKQNFIIEIALPDGWWYMEISNYGKGFYLYYIPDTRDREVNLMSCYFSPELLRQVREYCNKQ